MVINLTVVVGLYMFVGVSGVFSFGHAAFMAIGAYTGAILVIPPRDEEIRPAGAAGLSLPARSSTRCRRRSSQARWPPPSRSSSRSRSLGSPASRRDSRRSPCSASSTSSPVTGSRSRTARPGYPGFRPRRRSGGAWLGHRGDGGGVGVSALARRTSPASLARGRESAARSIGVAVARERTIAFVASAFFVGVAGALLRHVHRLVQSRRVLPQHHVPDDRDAGDRRHDEPGRRRRRDARDLSRLGIPAPGRGRGRSRLRARFGAARTAGGRTRARDACDSDLPARRADRRSRARLAVSRDDLQRWRSHETGCYFSLLPASS